jgi:hypothetical protein
MAFCIVRCVSLKAIFHRLIHTHTHIYLHSCVRARVGLSLYCGIYTIYMYIIYTAGSGRDHSSFKTLQVHDRNPTRSSSSTEDTLARSPRALRQMFASNPFLGAAHTYAPAHLPVSCTRTAKPTTKTRWLYYRMLICLRG